MKFVNFQLCNYFLYYKDIDYSVNLVHLIQEALYHGDWSIYENMPIFKSKSLFLRSDLARMFTLKDKKTHVFLQENWSNLFRIQMFIENEIKGLYEN